MLADSTEMSHVKMLNDYMKMPTNSMRVFHMKIFTDSVTAPHVKI